MGPGTETNCQRDSVPQQKQCLPAPREKQGEVRHLSSSDHQHIHLSASRETECYLKGPLECANRQQCQVLLLLCIPHQVHVHKLLELRRTMTSKTAIKRNGYKRKNTAADMKLIEQTSCVGKFKQVCVRTHCFVFLQTRRVQNITQYKNRLPLR